MSDSNKASISYGELETTARVLRILFASHECERPESQFFVEKEDLEKHGPVYAVLWAIQRGIKSFG